MYKLYIDNNVPLYDPRLPADHNVRDARVRLALNEPGSLSFTIDKTHPYNAEVVELATVTLYDDDEILYMGRVIREVQDFDGSRLIETEGLLATLNDSYIEPFEFTSSSDQIQSFLDFVLTKHNSQLPGVHTISRGDVNVTYSGVFAQSSDKFLCTWELVKNRLVDSTLGGHIIPSYNRYGMVFLNYYGELPEDNTQHIEFGKNMLGYESKIDSSDIHTAVLPLGKDGHTIKDYPDGATPFTGYKKSGYVVYKEDLEQFYGKRITKIVEFNDLETDLSLVIRAARNLRDIYNNRTITVRAVDLHLADAEVESFRIGKNIIVESAPHGLSESFPLVSLDIDISNPANTEITIGKITKSLTDRMRG